jgi:hypothetical protein
MARRKYPKAKPGELKAEWGIAVRGDHPNIVFAWGEGCYKSDGAILSDLFYHAALYPSIKCPENEKSFLKHLEERGYDITTLRFSIQKKKAETK